LPNVLIVEIFFQLLFFFLHFKVKIQQWGMQARAGRVTKVGKVSGKQMGFS
jgi:hypothetical protein